MLNTRILFILQILLFIKSNSTLIEDTNLDFFYEELSCQMPFAKKIEVDECTANSPSLELDESYKGQCCKISMSIDSLLDYKNKYNENWKNKIIKEFDLDEDITEEEIRNKYLPPINDEFCSLLLDSLKDVRLYQMALKDVNGEVKYDCGKGEETFKAKNYHPTDEDELIDKDYIDCMSEYTEKGCIKRSMKLSLDDSQCCWCEVVGLIGTDKDKDKNNIKECSSFRISKMKELFQKKFNSNKNHPEPFKYKCDCYNRKGDNIKASYNGINGEIIIE